MSQNPKVLYYRYKIKKKNLKIVWRCRLMSSVTAKNKRLAKVVKTYANADIKNFWF